MVTALCVWIAIQVNAAHRQRDAVAAILHLGGSVAYDWEREAGGRPDDFYNNSPPGPEWLRNLIGPDYFQNVVLVALNGSSVTDADVEILTGLPHLEILDLGHTQITNAGLGSVAQLKNLKYLALWSTKIDDSGLKYLSGLHELWPLHLEDTQITDAGLEQLKDLTNLEEWLGLSETKITDAGLRHLQKLSKLKLLNLVGTEVTEEAFANFNPI